MKIVFSTNLDKVERYVWRLNETWEKSFGDHIPAVGTNIEFEFNKWDHGANRSRTCAFELGVSSVRYIQPCDDNKIGVVKVELHMRRGFAYVGHGIQGADDGSVAAWEAWFRKYVENKDY